MVNTLSHMKPKVGEWYLISPDEKSSLRIVALVKDDGMTVTAPIFEERGTGFCYKPEFLFSKEAQRFLKKSMVALRKLIENASSKKQKQSLEALLFKTKAFYEWHFVRYKKPNYKKRRKYACA